MYDNSNNAVPGMTDPIGQLTTETAYSGGDAYTTQQKGFNVFGESLGETVTICLRRRRRWRGSYTFSHVYTTTTGLLLKDILPGPRRAACPPRPSLHGYATGLDLPDHPGWPVRLRRRVTYDAYSRVEQETIGSIRRT